MRSSFLPFSPPPVGDDEAAAAADAVRSGWLTTGPRVAEFEAAFAAYLDSAAALALNSCTAGLHTALVTLGVGVGDDVVTTPMTFASSVNVIEHVGARPLLADVEPDTLNIDPGAVERVSGSGTRALLPVHYAGHPVDLEPLRELAASLGADVVEDAAHAFPAKYKGAWIGSGPNPVAFSFYATKNLTTAEGGMLTGDPAFLEETRVVALHGMSRDAWKRYDETGSWYYEVMRPGFKYNMPDVLAAIGLVQLRRMGDFQARRRQIVARYQAAFGAEEALQTPVQRPEVEHAWHLYVLRIHPELLTIDRDRFIEEMKARNIGTSVHFIPIHLHPYYRDKYGFAPDDFPVALDAYRRMISLPLTPALSDQDVTDVIEAVLDVVATFRR
ncbi:MAG: DegT/DnrJ/EryC1/StrS family aminotransferase [Gemmatimonadales bacterium]